MGWATAFAQETEQAAKARWRSVAVQLRPTLPKLSTLMDEAQTDVLAYPSFPRAHHAKIPSVNPLERLNAEIQRRTHVVGFDGAPRECQEFRAVGMTGRGRRPWHVAA
jgi:putative transposase